LIWFITLYLLSILGLTLSYFRFPSRQITLSSLSPSQIASLPSVSIIRPLKGKDFNLYENLKSSLELEYPREKLQLLFSVENEEDKATEVARTLVKEWDGKRDVKLIVGRWSQIVEAVTVPSLENPSYLVF
jgi:ceramide glucosyltransferase